MTAADAAEKVDAAPTTAHVEALVAEGCTVRGIARAAGVDARPVGHLAHGSGWAVIGQQLADALLAVTPAAAQAAERDAMVVAAASRAAAVDRLRERRRERVAEARRRRARGEPEPTGRIPDPDQPWPAARCPECGSALDRAPLPEHLTGTASVVRAAGWCPTCRVGFVAAMSVRRMTPSEVSVGRRWANDKALGLRPRTDG